MLDVMRTLAAVMAADIVGYSAMMSADAEATLSALRRLRSEVFGPAVAGHRGRLVKSIGDGWIVIFRSASEAVTCAMRLQDRMAPDPDIRLRVGIHLGDIVHEDEDVFGDGVNVAARLEALCEPGGVAMTDAVHGMLDGTLRPAFDDMGVQHLKNIAAPVRVWSRGGISGVGEDIQRGGAAGFPALAIEPVAAAQEDMQDLADSLTGDLETHFSGTRRLRSRVCNSAAEGRYILRGRLRRSAARFRLETRLSAPDGSRLWSGKIDGDITDVFDWQDRAGHEIAAQVFAALSEAICNEVEAIPEERRSWIDWVLLAVVGYAPNRVSLEVGMQRIMRAIALAPESSYPYELALNGLSSAAMLGFSDIVALYRGEIEGWWRRIGETDAQGVHSRVMLAVARYNQTGDAAEARKAIDSFLRDLPFNPEALIQAGFTFLFIGDHTRSRECFRAFEKMGRHLSLHCLALHGLGSLHLLDGEAQAALAFFDEAIRLEPGYPPPYRWKAAALEMLGQHQEACAAMSVAMHLTPDSTVSAITRGARYPDRPGLQPVLDALHRAGTPA
jgi:adenylate cyclase